MSSNREAMPTKTISARKSRKNLRISSRRSSIEHQCRVLRGAAHLPYGSSYLDFSHLRTKGVRYARHRNPPKEAIDAYPTGHDDTGFDPVRATVLQARLAACPGAFGGRDPCPRKEDRKLCLARNGVG